MRHAVTTLTLLATGLVLVACSEPSTGPASSVSTTPAFSKGGNGHGGGGGGGTSATLNVSFLMNGTCAATPCPAQAAEASNETSATGSEPITLDIGTLGIAGVWNASIGGACPSAVSTLPNNIDINNWKVQVAYSTAFGEWEIVGNADYQWNGQKFTIDLFGPYSGTTLQPGTVAFTRWVNRGGGHGSKNQCTIVTQGWTGGAVELQ